jgi:hypothetical protein
MATSNYDLENIWVCSKPTVWDGDNRTDGEGRVFLQRSKPTVWDGDIYLAIESPSYSNLFQAHRVGCFFSLKFLKTKRKGFNILKAWKTGG